MDKGGAEKLALELAEGLTGDFKVLLCLLENTMRLSVDPKVEILSLKIDKRKWLISGFAAYKFAKELKRRDIKILVTFSEHSNYFGILTKLFYWKLRVISTIHTHLSSLLSAKKMALPFKLFIRNIYRFSDCIVTCSKLIRFDLIEYFSIRADKISTIYNGIRLGQIVLSPQKYGDFTFISIGSFYGSKNHKMIIDAFYELSKTENARLLLIGKGYMKQELEDYVHGLGLDDLVDFGDGYKVPIMERLKKSHCFVSASNREGFPLVLLEALDACLPIISTDCSSGPREILAPNTHYTDSVEDSFEVAKYGVLCPKNNSELFCKAMKFIMNNEEYQIRYKEVAQKRVKEFSMANYIKNFHSLILKISNRDASA